MYFFKYKLFYGGNALQDEQKIIKKLQNIQIIPFWNIP